MKLLDAASNEGRLTIVATVVFAALTIWWLALSPFDATINESERESWAAAYQLMALFGAICGIYFAQAWGGMKSVLGRAILAFSFGLLLQSFGQSVYSFYINVLDVEVPYPSIGDIGFFGSIPVYIYAVLQLAKVSGVKHALKSFKHQILALVIPIVLLVISYVEFLRYYEFDWSAPLTVFLDFGYPLGQAIYVSLAILTLIITYKVLGGVMRKAVIILLCALLFQYFSDYMFLYQAHKGEWYVGSLNDYLYLVSYFLMTLGLIYIGRMFGRVKES